MVSTSSSSSNEREDSRLLRVSLVDSDEEDEIFEADFQRNRVG